ncbi:MULTISPECIES: DEAD/DEAH box helicase family protein [Pseudomonas]|uniref:DEAD/DEAH box helicase n=1 Tax=Pseudomonas TaxID=286 RepID=UPI00287EC2ED|nr:MULTISPECIES: DEAD/DEAH box helicase family protein [Pseudomonas]MDS9592410.1 DEAD/DEAH box helicase family protein [Pseudomonas sp. HTZ1]WQE93237.1 DEAD/DEAH box helicase family protein [Pseudomonas aeruginosa]HBO6811513.1 DEAD/DEAH box helicase family protein [Pseudomonas aeruginosa]
MVDFNSKLLNISQESKIDPLELYETLDRASDKGPLREAQQEVLTEWHTNHRTQRDTIVKLHTGQGKTLIGLLMLQSLINEKKGPALYICPDNLLISQTKEQAKLFGIKVCDDSDDIPDEFTSGEKIYVTSVQKLFNGVTKFSLGARSLKVESILMDDAHACADRIRSACSLKIPQDEHAYSELLSLFAHHLTRQGEGTFADIENKRYGSYLPVPYWAWLDNIEEIARILSRHQDKKSIRYTWPLIKDRLNQCQCIISGSSIEIEPYIAPLEMFGSYWKANHRIFMSATVTDDAFLVKGLRLTPGTITSPLTYAKEKWSGEKMVLIPSLMDESLDRETLVKYFGNAWPKTDFGRVALVNSFNNSRDWSSYGALIADAESIQLRLAELKNKNYEKALVLVNRYDGIDLPDNDCRILIFDGKPYSQNLVDLYEEDCRPDAEATMMRAVRSVEQGLGRCVRGEKDYAAAVLTGPELIRLIRDKNSRKYLSSQVATQLEIGIEISMMAREDVSASDPRKAFIGMLSQSLQRDSGWKNYYVQRMQSVKERGANQLLLKIYKDELDAELLYQQGKHTEAVAAIQAIVDSNILGQEDRGWYLQLMARYSYLHQRDQSNKYQVVAHRSNPLLLAPISGVSFSKLTTSSQGRLERIKSWTANFGSYEQLNLHLTEILDTLSFGKKADKFEDALDKLSFALGFKGERPDKIWKEGPDNLWAVNDTDYLLWECKNDALPNKAKIDKRESEQMNRSCAWFTKHYNGGKSLNIIVHPSNNLESAGAFLNEVVVLKEKPLNKLKIQISNFFKTFEHQDFKDLSERQINENLNAYGLTATKIIEDFTVAVRDHKD